MCMSHAVPFSTLDCQCQAVFMCATLTDITKSASIEREQYRSKVFVAIDVISEPHLLSCNGQSICVCVSVCQLMQVLDIMSRTEREKERMIRLSVKGTERTSTCSVLLLL